MKSFSVVVPAHDCEHTIRAALQSVEEAILLFRQHGAAQRDANAEIVVVDDGSTDQTYPSVLDFAQGKGLYKLVRRTQASSPGCARNIGFEHSTGELLLFLDGDDLFLPEHILVCCRAMEESGVDFVKTQIRVAGPIHPEWKRRIEHTVPINLCIRRSCHELMSGFPDFHIFERKNNRFQRQTDIFFRFEDMFYSQLAFALFRVARVERETVEYLRHPGNMLDKQFEKFCLPVGQYREELTEDQVFRFQLCQLLTQHRAKVLKQQRGTLSGA